MMLSKATVVSQRFTCCPLALNGVPAVHVRQPRRQPSQPLARTHQQFSMRTSVAVHAALAGASGSEHHHNSEEKLSMYMKLTRIHNLIPSVILVVVGAWAGSGHRMSAVQSISVWLMGLISGGMAIASVVVNDYFDLKIDATNAPDKPLPSGAITPDAALLLSSLIYCSCLIAACLMEPSRLRSIVAFSAAATLLYTPLFKRLTAIKNATVASVIALAPLAGALAAGAGDAGLMRLLPATLYAFSGVMFREILMDLNDAEGDKQAGVWTLPVMLGKPAALACALCCLLLGSGGALLRILSSPGSLDEWLPGVGALAGAVGADAVRVLAVGLPAVVLLVAVGQFGRLAASVWRSSFQREAVDRAVGDSMKYVGWGILLLAALG